MSINRHCFRACQETVVAVGVSPACLQASQFLILKKWDSSLQPVWLGNEICIKDGDQFASRAVESRTEGTGFISSTIGAVKPFDIHALRFVLFDQPTNEVSGIIRRIVQDLNLNPLRRIF